MKKGLLDKYLTLGEQLLLILGIILMFVSPQLIVLSVILKEFLTALYGFFCFCIGELLVISECFKMVKKAEKKEKSEKNENW